MSLFPVLISFIDLLSLSRSLKSSSVCQLCGFANFHRMFRANWDQYWRYVLDPKDFLVSHVEIVPKGSNLRFFLRLFPLSDPWSTIANSYALLNPLVRGTPDRRHLCWCVVSCTRISNLVRCFLVLRGVRDVPKATSSLIMSCVL